MQPIDTTKFNNLKYYSQDKQDLLVLDYLQQKRDGFFVDVGAGHYMTINNTYLLETEYGWNGICVEGNLKCYMFLKEHRSCTCINKYIGTKKEKTIFNYVIPKQKFEEGYYSFIDVGTPIQQLIKKSHKQRIIQILVETELLMTILNENNAPHIIDYLSIDIEGLDFAILQTIDFNKYKFRIITIEEYVPNIHTVSHQNLLITKFLKPYGYKSMGRLSQDLVYINENI